MGERELNVYPRGTKRIPESKRCLREGDQNAYPNRNDAYEGGLNAYLNRNGVDAECECLGRQVDGGLLSLSTLVAGLRIHPMRDWFTFQNLPLTLIVLLIIWSWISFFSVILLAE